MTSKSESGTGFPLSNINGRARLTLVGGLVCSLVALGFLLLLKTPAQAFVSKGTSCSAASCHGASEATATVIIALNGTQGTAITVSPGSTFEVDWFYTNLRNTTKYDGTHPEIALPTGWTIARGTANSPALTGWSSTWDATGGVTSGWNTTYSTATEFPNSPVGYTIDYSGTPWDSGTRNAAADNGTAADLDGVANKMGGDARITVPAGASPGTYTVMVLGIGHNSSDTKAHVEQAITVTVSSGISQTITVGTPAPANAAYSSQFTVAATASSGLPVAYSSGSTSICTNSGATFTMVSGTGTCIVQYDQAGGSGYSAAPRVTNNVTATKINQGTAVSVSAPANAYYGQTGLSASASGGNSTGAYSYSAGSSTACTVSSSTGALTITSGTGSCSITATKAADSNYNVSAASAAATVAINKAAQATLSVTGPASVTYGSTGTITTSGGSGSGTMSYSHGASTGCTVNSSTGLITVTDASSSCSVTATKPADTNYLITTSAGYAVTLNKATQATVTVSAPASATYGQTGLSATASGGSSTGAYNYSAGSSTACTVNSSTGALTITSGTGNCSITATKAADTNYLVSAASSAATVTIGKATQVTAVTVSAPASATYGQAGLSATASGGDSTGAYSYSSGVSTACTVNSSTGALTITSGTGSCDITATKGADINYLVSAASSAATVAINKATQATLSVTGPASVTYGSTSTITTSGGSGTGTMSYSQGASTGCTVNTSTGLITVTDASGSCSVTATKPADTNYLIATSAGYAVTLNKATQATVTVSVPASATYGQTGLSATASGGSSTGAYNYSAGSSTACTIDSSTGALTITSGTGNCSITATKAADTNYLVSAASSAATVAISKATPAVSAWPTASGITYGQTLASSTLSGGTATPAGTFAFTNPATAPNAGTAPQGVTFTPTDTVNYNNATGTTSVAVDRANSNVTAWPTATGITYGQTLASSTLSGGTATPTGTFAFTNPTTVPPEGMYSASVTFTPTDTANYNTATGSVNVIVTIGDTTSPTVAITYSTPAPYKSGANVTITATFSEAMADSPVPQIVISGANTLTAINMTKSSATVYTYAYTVGAGTGTATVSIPTGKDLAGNNIVSTPTSGETFTVDNTVPVISATSPASDSYRNNATAGYTLSEAVVSGAITFTRTGGTADPTPHTYNLIAGDMTSGSHSVNTGLTLVNGTIYTVSFNATDTAGNSAVQVANTNVLYDTAAAAVTLSSPAAGSRTNNALVNYTLNKAIATGQIIFTRTGGTVDGSSPHIYNLSGADLASGSHAAVNTGFTLVDGAVYTVSMENVIDLESNPSAPVSNANVTYDSTAVAFTSTSPTPNSFIKTALVNFTLSEQAASGSVTFTRTDGAADPASPHSFSLTGGNLNAGAHTDVDTGLTLVEGSIYTVSFNATDMAGNPATTVSSALVTFDTTAPTLSPVHIASNNADPTKAVAGDVVTVTFTSSESTTTPTVTIAGSPATITGGPTVWNAAYTVLVTDPLGAVAFSISAFTDAANNPGSTVSAVTDASSVTVVIGGPANVTLTVAIDGTGSGTVNSVPSGQIACSGDCTETYTSGTQVTLTATTSGPSTFAGWSGGGCSGNGECIFNITADTLVTATFNPTPLVMLPGPIYYATIQAAYNAATVDAVLKLRNQTFIENLIFDGVNVTFDGGYDDTWTPVVGGYSTINGDVTIGGVAGGSVTINNMVIQ